MCIKRLFKRFTCKHNKTECVGTYMEMESEGIYTRRYIWRCKECGKEFWGNNK